MTMSLRLPTKYPPPSSSMPLHSFATFNYSHYLNY